MKTNVYNIQGKEVGEVELPESLFGVKRNDSVVRQIVLGMQSNARTPVAHAKGRGEVRGGGKKPWKQKGTGRARHGSIRSPLWRGGGTTHGPQKEENYTKKLNKKMRVKALGVVLSQKLKEGKILFVDALSFEKPQTKSAKAALAGLSTVKGFAELKDRRNNAALILLGSKNQSVSKSFSNMGNVMVDETRNTNPVDVLGYRYLIIVNPEESIKALTARSR